MKLSRILGFAVAAICIIVFVVAAVIVTDIPRPAGPGGKNEFVNNPATGNQKNPTSLPPNEAILSCTGKSTGDICQFKDRDGLSNGVCDNTPGVLACAPERKQNTGQMSDAKPAPQAMGTPSGNLQSGIAQSGPLTAIADKGTFSLTCDAGIDGGMLPIEYTCNGSGSRPALSWSGAPAGTKEFALMMTTLPVDGATRWNWVLYGIPGSTTSLVRNSVGVGTLGTGSHGTIMTYDPPCPQGPGAKVYTYTLYALSASPTLPGTAEQITGLVLTDAISSITLGKASFNMSYSRS